MMMAQYHLFVIWGVFVCCRVNVQIQLKMGPKKKEEEVDLSTLPQCRTLNAIVLVRGKKSRALALQQRLQKELERGLVRVKRSEVIDHAKEKGFYVDPASLTDKQKKDPKFMESVSTELTPEVVAKALKSHLAALTLKARIDRKNNPDKPEEKARSFDLLFAFEDFPESTAEFEELAKSGQNVKYVLVMDPRVSWANAPQLPEGDEEQQEDDVKEYRALLKKQERTQEDLDHEKQVDDRIAHIKKLRSQSSRDSEFRNCTISTLETEIDPYSEEQSQGEAIKLFKENINKLNADVAEFEQWRKERKAESMGEPAHVEHRPPQGDSVLSLLDSLAQGLDERPPANSDLNGDEEDIMSLINSFSAAPPTAPLANSNVSSQEEKRQEVFVVWNDYVGEDAALMAEVRKRLKFPGIDRFQMPEIPAKSEKLRKLHQSQYALFLKGLDLQEYFRRQQILNFQEYIKEFDEQRTYSFADRIYEEHHDRASLQRELYRALQFNEYSLFNKYDESSDKLYVMLVYRNNARRVSRRLWESSWRVLPNYESWLAYFKGNDANLANTSFFDIDYEKVGNIQENTRAHTLRTTPDGAVLISKDCTVSNRTQHLLYAIKKNFVFGLQHGRFFGESGNVRLYHLHNTESKSYETVILLPNCIIRLLAGGNVLVEKDGRSRMVTPNGYSIVYGQNGSTILHPDGGITHSSDTYTTPNGHGLKQGRPFECPTLMRKVQGGQIIKRDDSTVIVNSLDNGELKEKWVRFFDGTQYQVGKGRVRIEREGEPFITCQRGSVRVVADQLIIRITERKEGHTAVLELPDGNHLRILNENLHVFQPEEEGEIAISLQQNQISSRIGNDEVRVAPTQALYFRNGKQVDARQEEEKYGEEDVLPADYIEPRLFVVSNDNTAVQLVSEKMYQSYLRQYEASIDRVYEKKAAAYTECHVITKQGITNGKQIQCALLVNLDVFDNTNEPKQPPSHSHLAIKTFLRYDPLTPDVIADLHRIRTEVEAWRKQNAKEENEYGHREPRDPATKGKIEAKLLTIKKRQQKEARVKCESLRETARNFHLATYEEIQRQLERESREKQLRTQFLKKKNSVVREYKKVNVTPSPRRTHEPPQPIQQFMDHYFMTQEGSLALSQMPEWVFRPKEIKPPVQLDPEIQEQLNNTNGLAREEESEEQRERYDTVEVNLNPKMEKEIYIKPSVFTQREIDQERSAFEHEKKAYKYHEAKRKDFNVYGQERKSKPEVPTLLRTQPISEINQKYLVTEAPLDKKVKISSMKNKLTSSASSMVEMRKEGPHTLLIKTIDKGNDINRLLERRTMMVQADLNDKLQRDILINPVEANFGPILQRRTYQLKIQIKNQDVISQRITIKRPKSIHVKAQLSEMGPIAMGMTRKIIVSIRAAPEIVGKFADEFDIVTKHEIYHIPITAHILSEGQVRNESIVLQRGVIEVDENPKKKSQTSFELPRINK